MSKSRSKPIHQVFKRLLITVSQNTASTVEVGVFPSVSYNGKDHLDNSSSWSDITSANGKTYSLVSDDIGNQVR